MAIEAARRIRARHAILTVVLVLASAVGLRFVTEAFAVPSSSMAPTLLPGDHLVVVRYLLGEPRRGDVVVFDDGTGTMFVKRVIGLSGDSVQVDGGRVLVNGAPLDEEAYTAPSRSSSVTVHVVPRGHLFLLGDNRDHSEDSRTFGFVSRQALVGRARLIYWSTTVDAPRTVRWERVIRVIR